MPDYMLCYGSYLRASTWSYGKGTCSVCGRMGAVREDATIYAHSPLKFTHRSRMRQQEWPKFDIDNSAWRLADRDTLLLTAYSGVLEAIQEFVCPSTSTA